MTALLELFATLPDTRQKGKIRHSLAEMLVVAVAAILCGADNCTEIQAWGEARLDWLRRYLPLKNGIASHDTYSTVLATLDGDVFSSCFMQWAAQLLPAFAHPDLIAIDGKSSKRSKSKGQQPLHTVSAFAVQTRISLGQQTVDSKSNEKTAIPELLQALFLQGSLVSIDAMGTHANIARQIRDKGADYLLAVKGNQKHLAQAIKNHFIAGKAATSSHRSVEKDRGRIVERRCHVYTALDILPKVEQWPDLACFAVIESERHEGEKITQERRCYISSRKMDAREMLDKVRGHWGIENTLHWQLDVSFGDDQMRLRTEHAGRNMHVLKQLSLNLLRIDPQGRKGSVKTRRILAAGDDAYRAALMGL